MKATRRKMLGLLGVGAAVGPNAVAETMKQAGVVSGIGADVALGLCARPPVPQAASSHDHSEWLLGRVQRSKLLRAFMPEWWRRQVRVQARNIRVLDPDIASLRSVSVSAKLHMQWARVERQLIASEGSWSQDELEQQAWNQLHGVE